MNMVSVETLRTWLEEHRDVLVLDVRTPADYQEWAIPGSLHVDASREEAAARAEALYHSLQKLLALPGSTLVLAGHTSTPVPFDRIPVMTRLSEVEQQVDLLHVSRADFVQRLLGWLPVTPPNYMQIVKLNEQGRFPDEPVAELEAGANHCAIS